MYPASAALQSKVRDSSPTVRVKIESLKADLSLDAEVTAQVLADSRVELKDNADAKTGFDGRGTFDLLVKNPDGAFSRESFTNPFFQTRRLRISKGVLLSGAVEWVPLGVFQITRNRARLRANEQVVYVSGADLWAHLKRTKFSEIFKLAAGSDVKSGVIALLARAGLSAYAIDPGLATMYIGSSSDLIWQKGVSVAQATAQLLDDFGCRYWFDRSGVFLVRSYFRLDTSDAVYEISQAHKATEALDREYEDAEDFANDVIVASNAQDSLPLELEVSDSTDGSLLRADGPIGRRVAYVEAPVRTRIQASDLANDELRTRSYRPMPINYEGAPLFWLDPLDVVALTSTKYGLAQRKHVLERLSIPLASAGSSSMRLLALRTITETVFSDMNLAGYSVFITPWIGSKSNVNWSTRSQNSAALGGGFLGTNTGAQNNEVVWPIWLDAGIYKIAMLYRKDSDHGIYTVQLDGTGIPGGTIDGYGTGSSFNNYSELVGISIGTAKTYDLKLIMASKNASASAYLANLQSIAFIRTGP